MRLRARQVRFPNYMTYFVECDHLDKVTPQGAEVPELFFVPQKGMKYKVICKVGDARDLTPAIYSSDRGHRSVSEGADIEQFPAIPEKGMNGWYSKPCTWIHDGV